MIFKRKTIYNTKYKCVVCDAPVVPLELYPGNPKSYQDMFKMLHRVLSYNVSDLSPKMEQNNLPGDPQSEMINDGVIGGICANYGSSYDGDVFQIAICDSCIEKKMETGGIIFDHNYMGLDDLDD